jgi:hypothetical protein
MPEQEITDPSRFRQASRATFSEIEYRNGMEQYIENGVGSYIEKLENFSKYISRQTTARYLALYEIFKLVINVQGDIIEGGVNWGGGLMWFAQMSASLEPTNFQRRIIGFDTFSGFTEVSDNDSKTSQNTEMKKGGFAADSYEDLLHNVELFNKNRFIGHIPKVVLVKGDVSETIPKFIGTNPQQIVSLLHLDFDLYEPTKVALKYFLPRMPKGSVIVFDELNNLSWPGETVAVLEGLNISQTEIKRFSFEPHISYAIL